MSPKKVNIDSLEKKTIPKALKIAVWNKYIGEEIGKAKCSCCNITDITQLKFHTGHIIAKANGGLTNIDNLKPICESCNKSMGIKNMDEFKQLLISQSKEIIINAIKNEKPEIISIDMDILEKLYDGLQTNYKTGTSANDHHYNNIITFNTNIDFIKFLVDETKISHDEYTELLKYEYHPFLSKIQPIIDKIKYNNININKYLLDLQNYENYKNNKGFIPYSLPRIHTYILYLDIPKTKIDILREKQKEFRTMFNKLINSKQMHIDYVISKYKNEIEYYKNIELYK